MDNDSKKAALIIKVDGVDREISFEELTLSNNITLEALVRVLAKKNILAIDEFLTELQELEKERLQI
jgi:hypothetical protein